MTTYTGRLVTCPSRTSTMIASMKRHRVDRSSGRFRHSVISSITLSGDPGDGVLADPRAVHLVEVRGDLAGGQPRGRSATARSGRCHPAAAAACGPPAARSCRPGRGHLNLHWADPGQHRLGPRTVAGVAAIAASRVILVITQVPGHLRLRRGLEHSLGQPGKQASPSEQFHTLGTGPLHQVAGELLLIDSSRHGLDHLGHNWSFPGKQKARRVGPTAAPGQKPPPARS